MENLHAVAARLDEASATLTAIARAVAAAVPAQVTFGADGPGRPGDVGRALHRQWATATDNRAREATAAAARLAATASAIRSAAERYADTDAAARLHLDRGDQPDPWFGTDPAGHSAGAGGPAGAGAPGPGRRGYDGPV